MCVCDLCLCFIVGLRVCACLNVCACLYVLVFLHTLTGENQSSLTRKMKHHANRTAVPLFSDGQHLLQTRNCYGRSCNLYRIQDLLDPKTSKERKQIKPRSSIKRTQQSIQSTLNPTSVITVSPAHLRKQAVLISPILAFLL